MATGNLGTYVISWAQAELDGLFGASPLGMGLGSTWCWSGDAHRIDDSRDIFILEDAKGAEDLRHRAARKVQRLLGDQDLLFPRQGSSNIEEPLFKSGFEVTDGLKKYQITFLEVGVGRHPMCLFIDGLPPANQDLWVVSVSMGTAAARPIENRPRGTICFVPGTWIKTPEGQKQVQDLVEGDQICTRDNGVQTLRWIGQRDISGSRLMAMPGLRPVRIAAHVLADGEPDQDLFVSPDHRLLIKGAVAQDLFNTSEVLVAAGDLINDQTIRVDRRCRSLRYVHLMLDQHQIVWANGVQVESFHPAGMDPQQMDPTQRFNLQERFPNIGDDGLNYGDFARRNLSRSEAAILSHGGFGGH